MFLIANNANKYKSFFNKGTTLIERFRDCRRLEKKIIAGYEQFMLIAGLVSLFNCIIAIFD